MKLVFVIFVWDL